MSLITSMVKTPLGYYFLANEADGRIVYIPVELNKDLEGCEYD
jgi:hypothetical protein